jgi:hypothetical protein
MRKYTPRRANRRWLEGAPEYVLDVFDNKGQSCDRYTVMFCGSELISNGTRRGTFISYLAMSGAPSHPQGVSLTGELAPHKAGAYRYRSSRHRIRWLDLPEHIREHVKARINNANEFVASAEGAGMSAAIPIMLSMARPYCDNGCGERAVLRLAEVGLCGDCGADHLRPGLSTALGYVPCARILETPDCTVACLVPYGVEHDHQDKPLS